MNRGSPISPIVERVQSRTEISPRKVISDDVVHGLWLSTTLAPANSIHDLILELPLNVIHQIPLQSPRTPRVARSLRPRSGSLFVRARIIIHHHLLVSSLILRGGPEAKLGLCAVSTSRR